MKRPFVHAHATRAIAENLICTVDMNGFTGVGESVPRDYVTGESPESAYLAIKGFDFNRLAKIAEAKELKSALLALEAVDLAGRLTQKGMPGLAASCTVELACLDALGKKFAMPLQEMVGVISAMPSLVRAIPQQFPLTVIIGYDRDLAEYRDAMDSVVCVKVKVGRDDEEDIVRVSQVREVYGAKIGIALDANMAWSLKQALAIEKRLRNLDICWYEQPFAPAGVSDCATFRKMTGAKILLDESLCSFTQALAAIQTEACDMFNIRISKCGGLISSIRVAELARKHSLGYILGGHPGQNGILTAADRAFAAKIDGILACESFAISRNLESLVIREDIFDSSFKWSELYQKPGIGVTLDLAKLQPFIKAQHIWNA